MSKEYLYMSGYANVVGLLFEPEVPVGDPLGFIITPPTEAGITLDVGLVARNIRYERESYVFQLEGDDKWYRSYSKNFVLNTPDNLARYHRACNLKRELQQITEVCNQAQRDVELWSPK